MCYVHGSQSTGDSLRPQALGASDWEGLHVVWERADDAVTAMPLYTNAVEGSRSSKRKKKSDVRRPAANPHITATLIPAGHAAQVQKSMLKATNPCSKQGPHVRRCPNLGATWGVARHWEGLQVSLLAERYRASVSTI